jgi:hypothetical protein
MICGIPAQIDGLSTAAENVALSAGENVALGDG